MAFKPGDIVQLRSGGPKMTVEKDITGVRQEKGSCYCKWFAGAKLERGHFCDEELQPYVEETKKK